MLSYKLAKQLKDAGFPYKENDMDMKKLCLCTEDVCNGPFGREFRFDGELYSEPTLSELIEACMKKGLDGDFHLESLHGEWGASTCWMEEVCIMEKSMIKPLCKKCSKSVLEFIESKKPNK